MLFWQHGALKGDGQGVSPGQLRGQHPLLLGHPPDGNIQRDRVQHQRRGHHLQQQVGGQGHPAKIVNIVSKVHNQRGQLQGYRHCGL